MDGVKNTMELLAITGEDELALAKGCFAGLLLATPLWILMMLFLKWILTH